MKTKEEILKMTNKELEDYKWSEDLSAKIDNLGCSECSACLWCSKCFWCSKCSECSECLWCSKCFWCSKCYLCRNAKNLKWAICNVEVGEEAYKAKMKELGIEQGEDKGK